MRKLVVTAGIAGLLLTGAGTARAESENADPNACFGQARAAGVQALQAAGENFGADYASERKGDNAEQNRDFREACRAG